MGTATQMRPQRGTNVDMVLANYGKPWEGETRDALPEVETKAHELLAVLDDLIPVGGEMLKRDVVNRASAKLGWGKPSVVLHLMFVSTGEAAPYGQVTDRGRDVFITRWV